MNQCSFCSEINNETENNLFLTKIKPFIDIDHRVIFSSENWLVIPTIGSFIPGYLLIVTKQHYTSIGECPAHYFPELECLIQAVRGELYRIYKTSVLAFEHGAINSHNIGGCCVDHAHLHILPAKEDVLKEIKNNGFHVELINSIIEIKQRVLEKQAYLFYQDTQERYYVTPAEIVPSQYLRKMIAHSLGLLNAWDWRLHSGVKNILSTLSAVDKAEISRTYYELMKSLNNL